MTRPPAATPLTEKRCRICRQAHWRAPAGWIADHTSEPVDMPIEQSREALEARLAEAERLLGEIVKAWEHAAGTEFLRMGDAVDQARAFLASAPEGRAPAEPDPNAAATEAVAADVLADVPPLRRRR